MALTFQGDSLRCGDDATADRHPCAPQIGTIELEANEHYHMNGQLRRAEL
jgi:hypothetical protein